MTEKLVNWPEVIESILSSEGLSVRKLAAEIEISDVFLGYVRKGVQPASPMLKFKLLERQGSSFDLDDVLTILPDEVAEKVRRIKLEKLKNENIDAR